MRQLVIYKEAEVSLIFTYILLGLASYYDLKIRRIPNKLTFFCMILGLMFSKFPYTEESHIRVIGCIVLFLLGSFRLMGLGDIKLCMAVMCLRGIQETVWMMAGGIVLLFLYCIWKEPKGIKSSFEGIYQFFRYRIPIQIRSQETYPFAVFLGIAYTVLSICEVMS